MKTTSTQRMKAMRESRRKEGLVRLPEIWCRPEHKERIQRFAESLRETKKGK